ncbi:hypothetical protein AA0121_g13451 [Alternaria tenuissima]|nr:hypothetical protein AA0121_g13451 [Alternaria tenuissima]
MTSTADLTSDEGGMVRMGRVQQSERIFDGLLGIFSFSVLVMVTWPTVLTTLPLSLTNGGTGGAIWMFAITTLGISLSNISLAEMSSMAPAAGGQIQFASEFAPKRYQKFISYIVGWLCVLSWQTGTASMAYLASGQVQGLIVLNNTSYHPEPWHNTVIIICIALVATLFRIYLARRLSWIECFAFVVLYFGGFVAIIVTMVICGREKFSKPKDVFFGFQDNAGWGSIPEAMLVGQIAAIFSLLGGDAPIHMSEEVKNASLQVPRAITFTALASFVFGFPMLVVFCFCLGDVETVLATRTGQPYIQILYNTTQSTRWTNSLVIFVIMIQIFAVMNFQGANSRQTQAFAQTNGLPFSKWLQRLPYSVWTSFATTVALSLINVVSPTAFNLVASLGISAIFLSYLICIVCLLIKRYRQEELLPRKYNLGRFGVWINVVAVLYLAVAFCFIFFPSGPISKFEELNWSLFILIGVIFFSVLFYMGKGRKNYVSPAEGVEVAAGKSVVAKR